MMKKFPKEIEEAAIELYKKGNSMANVGSLLKISLVTVKNILERNNIPKRTKGGIYALPEETIIQEYRSGLSSTDLSIKYNVNPHTITNLLEKNNIERNNRYYNINLKEDYFENIDTNDKAYFLGFLLTDGNIGSNSNAVSLCLA